MNTNLKKSKIVLKGKKIPKINEVFENGKIRSQDYCIESTYKAEENNKSYREIQVTKKACEFIANKSNEEKGIIPTNKYMKKFDRIENELYGGILTVKNLEERIQNIVTKEIDRLRKEHSEYIKSLSTEKRRIA
ncbi:Rha family transcriptional regulator [Paraclostridium sordellii]|uniref:Rha family transcriptional regulator n=1 Tax=Paraclostridium sordellii TaxID=1505 RepID=UPI001C6146DE|nr:Rha family transcriptional regulator [Paeniclostridium sordellii]QYE99310.1 hypothetical protein KZ987_07325 [Paeniclostridium sordellii]